MGWSNIGKYLRSVGRRIREFSESICSYEMSDIESEYVGAYKALINGVTKQAEYLANEPPSINNTILFVHLRHTLKDLEQEIKHFK